MRARMDMSPGYTLCCAGCTTGGFRGLRTSSQPVTGQPVLLWIWIIRLIICRILSETSHVLSDLTLLGAACSRTACFAQIGLSQPRRVHGTSQDQVVRTRNRLRAVLALCTTRTAALVVTTQVHTSVEARHTTTQVGITTCCK